MHNLQLHSQIKRQNTTTTTTTTTTVSFYLAAYISGEYSDSAGEFLENRLRFSSDADIVRLTNARIINTPS